MADYHHVYKEPEGTTTEWEDLQIKYGNMEPVAKPQNTLWEPARDEARKGDDDDLSDDLEGPEDDDFIAKYREKRMEELKAVSARPRFGTVELIKALDFVREVTNSSRENWVVCFLFKDGFAKCAVLGRALDELAAKFNNTKFVKIVSTDCVPNFPDANLPTLLVYSGGALKETLSGLQQYTVGGQRCTPEAVALALCRIGPVLAGPDESEEDVLERVRRDVIRGVVEEHGRERERASFDDDDD